MADSGLTPQTVKSYLSAIRNTQLSLGLPDPREQSSLPMLKRVQAGISRTRLGRGHPSRVWLPITAALLRRIKHELGRTSHPERIVLWAICCAAFFRFCRLGELLLPSPGSFNPRLHLAWGDMAVDNPLAPPDCQTPPQAIEDRPVWPWGGYYSGEDRPRVVPRRRHIGIRRSTGRPPGAIFSVIVDVAPHQANFHHRAQEDPDGAGPPGRQLCGL